VAISIRLDPNTVSRLEELAQLTGRSKSYYLRELIESGLADMEDFYLADAAMERVRKGQDKLVDSQVVRKELGLDH
jgi:RHH-type rel operon transcriptional repressor/antitoxin RelB